MVKIYKIICDTTKKIYIGYTKLSLHQRLSLHKSEYNRYMNGKIKYYTSSFNIIKNNNYKIKRIENCSESKKNIREQYYINKIKCVNIKKT